MTSSNLGRFYDRYWSSSLRIREDVTRRWWGPVRQKALAALKGRTLLLGCGPGDDLDDLARAGVRPAVGLDISEAAVQSARRRGHAVVRAAADALPFRPEAFESVWVSNVLMFTRRRRCLDECRRVSSPGGRVVLTEPRAEAFLIGLARRFQPLSRLTTSYWRTGDIADLGGTFASAREEVFFLLSPLWAGFWYGAGLGPFSSSILRFLVAVDSQLLEAFPFLKRRSYLSLVVYETAPRRESGRQEGDRSVP